MFHFPVVEPWTLSSSPASAATVVTGLSRGVQRARLPCARWTAATRAGTHAGARYCAGGRGAGPTASGNQQHNRRSGNLLGGVMRCISQMTRGAQAYSVPPSPPLTILARTPFQFPNACCRRIKPAVVPQRGAWRTGTDGAGSVTFSSWPTPVYACHSPSVTLPDVLANNGVAWQTISSARRHGERVLWCCAYAARTWRC